MLGSNLRRFLEAHGVAKTTQFFSDARKQGKITDRHISLRDLAEGLMGHAWESKLRRFNTGRTLEATDAVDASAFSNITGAILFDRIKDRYEAAEFIGDTLVSVEGITNGNLGPQKEPWLGGIVNAPSQVQPGMPYPRTSFGEYWITHPAPTKFGLICSVTFEMIYSDLTKQAMDAAADIGERVRINREEKILSVVTGLSNPHLFNDVAYDTYQTATPWINQLATEVLLEDWTDIEQGEMLFSQMLDPATGKSIRVKPSGLLVMPKRFYTAKRILTATMVRSGPGGGTTNAGQLFDGPSPLEVPYPIFKTPYARQLAVDAGHLAADVDERWFLGDFKGAFCYREVWPGVKIEELPPNSQPAFEQDIVLSMAAKEFGSASVRDPRRVVRSYHTT